MCKCRCCSDVRGDVFRIFQTELKHAFSAIQHPAGAKISLFLRHCAAKLSVIGRLSPRQIIRQPRENDTLHLPARNHKVIRISTLEPILSRYCFLPPRRRVAGSALGSTPLGSDYGSRELSNRGKPVGSCLRLRNRPFWFFTFLIYKPF